MPYTGDAETPSVPQAPDSAPFFPLLTGSHCDSPDTGRTGKKTGNCVRTEDRTRRGPGRCLESGPSRYNGALSRDTDAQRWHRSLAESNAPSLRGRQAPRAILEQPRFAEPQGIRPNDLRHSPGHAESANGTVAQGSEAAARGRRPVRKKRKRSLRPGQVSIGVPEAGSSVPSAGLGGLQEAPAANSPTLPSVLTMPLTSGALFFLVSLWTCTAFQV